MHVLAHLNGLDRFLLLVALPTVIVAVPLVFWFWPKRGETARDLALEKRP